MSKSVVLKHNIGFLSHLPVGSIIAWHKDLEGTPDLPPGWVECNGQTLEDSDSPYHGKVIPNLNGEGRFLRGAMQSGKAQAQDWKSFYVAGYTYGTYVHSDVLIPKEGYNTNYPFGGKWESVKEADGYKANRLRFKFDNSEIRPINMSMVWIIKVKQVTAAWPSQALQAEEQAPPGAVYVSRAGNVGIGTTEPGARLDINGYTKSNPGIKVVTNDKGNGNFGLRIQGPAGTERAIGFYTDDKQEWWFGRDNEGDMASGIGFWRHGVGFPLVIRDTGKVGIGTTTPGGKLHVQGSIIAEGISVAPTNTTRGALWLATYGDFNHALYNNYSNVDGEGTWDGHKWNTYAGLNIRIGAGGSKKSALFIDGPTSGNVGIGTENPDHKLHVAGEFKSPGITISAGGSWRHRTDGDAAIVNDASHYKALMIVGADYNQGYKRWVRLWDHLQVNGGLDVTGKVGIGTTSPGAKLDVNGTLKAKEVQTTLYRAAPTSSVNLSSDNTWRNFPGLSKSISLAHATNVIIFYQITMGGGGSHLVTRLAVDGKEMSDSRAITGNTTYWSPSNIWIGRLSAGNHTVTVQYRTPKGGTNQPAGSDWHNRALKILILGS